MRALLLLLAATALIACNAPREMTTDAGPERCASCHLAEYLEVRDPPHDHVRPLTCAVCHSSTAWSPAVFHHPAYPLTGAHLRASCLYCHEGTPPDFVGVSTLCVDCHQDDFESSTFPGHSTFATTCGDCHSTATWKSATPPPLPPDAGVDVVTSGSHHGGIRIEPPPLPLSVDAGPPPIDAGPPRVRHRRPPRPPIDVITHPSR